MWLRLDANEESYQFNLGDNDTGVIQSVDHQLRSLESHLEKNLAAHRELQHRRAMISEEVARGWDQALKYQELRDKLTALNDQLNWSGCEFEPSPELSELDAEAFMPAPAKVRVRQLVVLPVAESAAEDGAPANTTPADCQAAITPDRLRDQPVFIERERTGSPISRSGPKKTGGDGASATVNGSSKARTEDFFSQAPENSGRRRRRWKKEEDTLPSNKDPGTSEQMRFDWS